MDTPVTSVGNCSISTRETQPEVEAHLLALSLEELQTTSPEWSTLSSLPRWREPFFQPEWFSAFALTFAKGLQLYLLSARWQGSLVAAAPLLRANTHFGRIPARTYRSLSGLHSCRYDLLHAPAYSTQVGHALWSTIQRDPWWEVIEALDVPEGGGFTTLLPHAQREGFLIGVWPTRKSPYLPIPAVGHDPFSYCPVGFRGWRSKLARKLQRLRHTGEISFDCSYSAQPGLDEFLALEAAGWKGQRGSAIVLDKTTTEFYTRIVDSFARRGALRFCSLRVDAKPIAMHLGLLMNGTYFVPKSAYDETFARFSPGHLLVHHVLHELPSMGARTYDFLGPAAQWKSMWTSHTRAHHNYYIFRPSVRGRLLHFAITQAAPRLRDLRYRVWGDPQAVPSTHDMRHAGAAKKT